jgi:hypothetical protein
MSLKEQSGKVRHVLSRNKNADCLEDRGIIFSATKDIILKEFPSLYWYIKTFVFLVKEINVILLKLGVVKFAEHDS